MARSTKSNKRNIRKEKEIQEVADLAAEEAVEELDQELSFGGLDGDGNVESQTEFSDLSNDVFEEGFKRCLEWKDSPRFHIKKNSQLVGFKDYPYSWERLFQDFGPGYYHVTCKGRTTGRIAKQQTEIIGDPNEGREVEADDSDKSSQQDNNLAVLGWLQQSQERAETRARELAKTQENSLATVMQTVMQAQQQSQQTMMTLFMEQAKQTQQMMLTLMTQNQSKGPDPVVTLLTTLLTKDKPKEGMGFDQVLKMLADKERDTRQAVEKQFEMIEKKADALAEVKAAAIAPESSGEEESLSKTLLKAFIPVLPQIMQGAQNPQFQAQGNPQLGSGFVEQRDTGTQPAIAAARPQSPRAGQPVSSGVQAAQSPNGRTAPSPVNRANPSLAGQSVNQAAPSAPRSPAPQPGAPSRPAAQAAANPTAPTGTQVGAVDSRVKDMIFNFVASDIASAMLQGVPASPAAEAILKKLEIEGVPRQTVASSFTQEDFYGYADQFIPAEHLVQAKSWLKEFHEHIQKAALAPAPVPVSANPNGQHGTGATVVPAQPVPAKRGAATRRAGAPAREPAKNI